MRKPKRTQHNAPRETHSAPLEACNTLQTQRTKRDRQMFGSDWRLLFMNNAVLSMFWTG